MPRQSRWGFGESPVRVTPQPAALKDRATFVGLTASFHLLSMSPICLDQFISPDFACRLMEQARQAAKQDKVAVDTAPCYNPGGLGIRLAVGRRTLDP